jgi:hypothetical protein
VAPYGRASAVLAIALSVALLSSASARELIQLGLAASSGIVVYALFGSAARRARRREALKLSEDR